MAIHFNKKGADQYISPAITFKVRIYELLIMTNMCMIPK